MTTEARAYVFAYGSLLNPESLRSTLPHLDLGRVLPARLAGGRRTWDLAFPNSGEVSDKAYFDQSGARPPFILFANLSVTDRPGAANGILVPLADGDLDRLARREGRYDPVDVRTRVRLPPAAPRAALGSVMTFLGKPRFTRPEDVAQGLLPAAYLRRIEAGVAFWEARAPGFGLDYRGSTDATSSIPTAELRRVDG